MRHAHLVPYRCKSDNKLALLEEKVEMYRSTLCYLRNGGKTLMMHRTKKENDVNKGKWIGVGGKFEDGETAGECLIREVKEETGTELHSFIFHGIIYFRNDEFEDEEMYLYS